jgi:phospholipid/cholesterol/gamma-HCH transport system substrate-binding protein
MAVERSYARLGLFLVVALVVVLASSLLFIQRLRSRTAIEFVSYTTENVSGLDVASPVRYRGVSIGRVTDVRVDTHGGTIEIDFQIFLDRLKSIGANVEKIRQTADVLGTFPNLRAQVIGNPVTGEAYLLLDAPANPPAPMALGFTPDRPYIPSMPTTLSSMRDRLPEVLERAETTLQVLGEIVSRIPGSLDRSDRFFTNVERIVQESNLPALSADSRRFFATSGAQIERIASEMEGVVGTRGTLTTFVDEARAAIKAADLPATNQSARAAADQTTLAADDLRRSLPAIRDSLEQLRALARQLQDQPESVVYGPRPAAVKR